MAAKVVHSGTRMLLAMSVGITFTDHVATITSVYGDSMQPTFNPGPGKKGDFVLLNKWNKSQNLKRGDIVVLTSPQNPNEQLIKRIIALEGDVVRKKNKKSVSWQHFQKSNELRQLEQLQQLRNENTDNINDYNTTTTTTTTATTTTTTTNEHINKNNIRNNSIDFEQRNYSEDRCIYVPNGHCWVEGDNPQKSVDSNRFGPISMALIQGKVIQIVWPPERAGTLNSCEPCPIRFKRKNPLYD